MQNNYFTLQECELDELVKHGLRALRDTLPNEVLSSIYITPPQIIAAKLTNYRTKMSLTSGDELII